MSVAALQVKNAASHRNQLGQKNIGYESWSGNRSTFRLELEE